MKKKHIILIVFVCLIGSLFAKDFFSRKRIEAAFDGAERYKLQRELQGEDTRYNLSDEFAYIPIGDYIAKYNLAKSTLNKNVSSSALKERKGEFIAETMDESTEDTFKWYSLKERDGIRYLMRESVAQTYTLWSFVSFTKRPVEESKTEYIFSETSHDTYTYGSVLKQIYGVTEASDIKCILASPIYDDTKINLVEELITDANEIEKLYGIMCDMNYYLDEYFCKSGSHNYGKETHQYYITLYNAPEKYFGYYSEKIAEEAEKDELACVEKYHRVLTIVLKDGTTIDNLHYAGSAGAFYDYVIYDKLDEQNVKVLNQLFGIK